MTELTQAINMSIRRASQGQEDFAWRSLQAEVGQMVMKEIGHDGRAFVGVVHERVEDGLNVKLRITARVKKGVGT